MDLFRTLVIDRGNTSAKVAIFESGECKKKVECPNNSNREIIEGITAICRDIEESNKSAIQFIYSCVGKEEENSYDSLMKTLPSSTIFLNHELPLWIKQLHKIHEALGCDRVAAIAGAYKQHQGKPILIVDSGTAIAYDFIGENGERVGGMISAGVDLRLKALHQHTALLPEVSGRGEVPFWGYDTETEMRSGAVRGAVYEIAYIMEQLKKQYPQCTIVLTGGNCSILAFVLKEVTFVPFEVDALLVLKGLNAIAEYEYNERYKK